MRERNRRLWLVGASISLLGDGALMLAFGIWIQDLTGSSGLAGLAFFFSMVTTLVSPATGLWADRVRKRELLLGVDLVLAVACLPALLVRGADQVWLLFAVLAVVGLGSQVTLPAGGALLTQLVPADELGRANAVLRSAKEAGMLVAPAVGAGLYATVGARAVVLLECGTFLVAAACVALVRHDEPTPTRGEPGHLVEDMLAGVRHLRTEPLLRRLTTAAVVAVATLGISTSLMYELIQHHLHRPPTFLAVLNTVEGVASLATGLLAARVAGRFTEERLVRTGLVLLMLATLLPLLPGTAAMLASSAFIGTGAVTAIIGLVTAVQLRTPAGLQGRAGGAVNLLLSVPQMTSALVGAAVVGVVPSPVLLIVMSVGSALGALSLGGLSAPGWRSGSSNRSSPNLVG